MGGLYFRVSGDYASDGPVFATRAECPWLDTVERHWLTIRREFEAYQTTGGRELSPSFVPDDVEVRGWRSINFMSYAHWYQDSCRHFPETVALLRSIPHLTAAFINLLEAHATLPPHHGDTNATYRCHLGLIVPGDVGVCGLEAGGERTGWREGECFAFDEAHLHRVWNHTDRPRVVMVFDVLRPAYHGRMLEVCGGAAGAMGVVLLETKLPVLRRLPAPARRLLHRGLSLGARAMLRLRDGVR